jgi:hypothetical protein
MSDINEVSDVALKLRCECERRGIRISFDGRVTESDAAKLLEISHRTLRRMRDERRGPRAVRMPLFGCSWSYYVNDLFRHISDK